jgi:aldehyde dehydrogenase (NAD+)
MKHFEDLFLRQEDFYNSGKTLDLKLRKQLLLKFANSLKKNEAKMAEAVFQDLSKPYFEFYTNELASVEHEARWAARKLRRWSKPQRVPTNLVNLPGRSVRLSEPMGTSLVIGTWNYPYLLTLKPAVSSFAAGNTIILKPSEHSPASAQVIKDIVTGVFPEDWFRVVLGGIPEVTDLLALPFDKIFFTGSTRVGKIVMKAAAENLASLTLELGGKSPALVLKDYPRNVTARRLIWGKCLNSGQTCIAPDYVLVDESVADELVAQMREEIEKMFGKDPSRSGSFGRIVDENHFNRLVGLIDPAKLAAGGQTDASARFIGPTVLYPCSFEDPVMQDEIFGPILAVVPFKDLEKTVRTIKSLPKPLAFYVFSSSRKLADTILSEVSFGGGCRNDTILHIANPNLPFGGIGPSGMGRYHGRAGFEEFSHRKSVLKKSVLIDPWFRYPPYTRLNNRIIRKLM